MKYKQIFEIHKIAIIFAILTSLIAVSPQAYFRYEHKNDGIYQGIEMLPNSPWLGRVREIQDGHGFGSIYYKDGKNDPYLFQPLGSIVVAYTGELFSLDIGNTFLLSSIIFSLITFLVLYGFIFTLSKDKLVALCGSTVVLLAQPILSVSVFSRLFLGIIPTDFWELSQSANPAMIYILFFGFLVLFWLFYQKRDWQWGVASAIILGLNFYNYFYTATYLYAFGGILVLIFVIQKKWFEVKRIFYVFAGALLVAIPYIFNMFRATQHPNYESVAARFAVINSHSLLFIGVIASIALVIFIFWFPRTKKEEYPFCLALLLAPILTMNQQIITGKILQVGHYHWYYHRPIAIILVIITVFYLLDRYGWNLSKKVLATIIILVSFTTASLVQVNAYFHDSHMSESIAIENQKYGPVMKWLNANVEKEAVVFANNETSSTIVIYTPLNVFYHHAALHSLSATKERLRDQLFTYYRLRKIGENDVQEVFQKEKAQISTDLYGLYYRDLYGNTGDIPQEKLDEIIYLYKQSLSTPTQEWLKEIWNRYEVEYLVWDKKANPDWQLQNYAFLKEMAIFGDIAIYSFEP